jgi:hypothetical protein
VFVAIHYYNSYIVATRPPNGDSHRKCSTTESWSHCANLHLTVISIQLPQQFRTSSLLSLQSFASDDLDQEVTLAVHLCDLWAIKEWRDGIRWNYTCPTRNNNLKYLPLYAHGSAPSGHEISWSKFPHHIWVFGTVSLDRSYGSPKWRANQADGGRSFFWEPEGRAIRRVQY